MSLVFSKYAFISIVGIIFKKIGVRCKYLYIDRLAPYANANYLTDRCGNSDDAVGIKNIRRHNAFPYTTF